MNDQPRTNGRETLHASADDPNVAIDAAAWIGGAARVSCLDSSSDAPASRADGLHAAGSGMPLVPVAA